MRHIHRAVSAAIAEEKKGCFGAHQKEAFGTFCVHFFDGLYAIQPRLAEKQCLLASRTGSGMTNAFAISV